MIIEYETNKFIKEKQKIEINDTKNVFLQGTNAYDGLDTYFGIWENKDCFVIVTLISNRNISYEYSTNKNVYTECDIKRYLENCKNVKVISKSDFTKQLSRIIKILEI